MDSVKKPEMILSVVSIVGVVALSVYGQKRLSSIDSEISNLQSAYKTIAAKVTEPNRADAIRLDSLSNDIKILKAEGDTYKKNFDRQRVSTNNLSQDVQEIMDTLETIVTQLKDHHKIDIKISKPVEEVPLFSRRQKPVKPQVQIRHNYPVEAEDEDDLDEQLNVVRNNRRNGRLSQ